MNDAIHIVPISIPQSVEFLSSVNQSDLERHDSLFANGELITVTPLARKGRLPTFIILISIATCCTYLYGLFEIKDTEIGIDGPISPPYQTWWFFTVLWWPDCGDVRAQSWRLFSYQFVHASPLHLGSNIVCLLLYGLVYDSFNYFGPLETIIVYEISMVIGAIGHSFAWPYNGLVGCSPGVYGIIGAMIPFIILRSNHLPTTFLVVMRASLFAQIILEAFYYYFAFSISMAYVAHFFGFITGICLSTIFACCADNHYKEVPYLALLGILSTTFNVEVMLLSYHFITSWPPTFYSQSYLHNNNFQDCCMGYLKLQHNYQYSREIILSNSSCNNNVLYFNSEPIG